MSYTYPWTRRTPQVRLPEHQLGQAIHRPPGSLSVPRIPVRNPFGVSGSGSFGTFLANIGRGGSEHRGALVSDQPALLTSRSDASLFSHPRVSLPEHVHAEARPPTRGYKRKLPPNFVDHSRRTDITKVAKYTRGNRATAAACDVAEAVTNMSLKETTINAQRVKESKLKTWDLLSSKIGVREFTETGAIKVLRLLSFAGYRSSTPYADLAVQRYVKSGGVVSEAFKTRLRAAKRAAKRGLGPPKQGEVFPLSNFFLNEGVTQSGALASSEEEWVLEPEAPFGQERMAIVASWWMLREIEVASLKVSDVIPHTGGIVGLRFEVQKNDSEGSGESIFLQCICGEERVRYCPTCTLQNQVSLVQRRLGDFRPVARCDAPLFPTRAGRTVEKRMVVKVVETVASRKGFPLKTASGRKKYGGHFFRILGATWLCERGILRERIMALGRWRSNAIDRYLRNSPLKTVFSISREVRASESRDKSGPCLKGVGCDGIPLRPPLIGGAGEERPRENEGCTSKPADTKGLRLKGAGGVGIPSEPSLEGGATIGGPTLPEPSCTGVTISSREVMRLAPETISCEGDSYRASRPKNPLILSNSRNGRIHIMAGEVMGSPLGWEARCGWRFGAQGPAAWIMVPTRTGSDLCNRCFSNL